MTRSRFFFLRRRLDALALVLAMAAISVLVSAGKVLFGALAVSGLVLAVIRPKSWNSAPKVFSLLLAAYCIWSIGLSLLRGEGLDGNRLLSYAAIELAVVFLPLGLFFIRKPLDAMILGARIGVVALLLATVTEFWLTGERIGLGRNPAILGFMVAAAGLIARLPMDKPVRFLPNGRWWLYVSLVPALLTQTRAAWGVYPAMAVLDMVELGRSALRRRDKNSLAVMAIAGVVAAVVLLPFVSTIVERGQSGMVEIHRYETTGVATGSVDVRLAMWDSALQVLAQTPAIGVGHVNKMAIVSENAGVNKAEVGKYTHLHNLVVDEALNSGLIGLSLLLLVFGCFIVSVFVQSRNVLLRETAVVFVFLVFSYGSFHGVLLNEWMIILVFGFMSVTLTDLARRRRALAIRQRL
ncbi:hypothetical protein FPY71_05280 [Aureimonas fodinaquatilis]|uniref:O-antigen ligase-related domain-containing protein n=1 Tax=Aureimonas fodinaquatilis TaxID=2565783 RepID=A0A5B0E3I6_9HYPH|nr:O-antigen ligase family protein [Aureimonas fodinaquatilis]KAA0972501.1 hypothetical protein FPY71_05280 [Aureimonas fodinaquatilis]